MASHNHFDLNFLPDIVREFDLNEIPSIEQNEEVEGGEHQSTIDPENGDISHGESERQRRNYGFLSNEERERVYATLLERSVNGTLKCSTTVEVSSMLNVPLRTVQRNWQRAKNTPNGSFVDVSHKKPKNCGRKRVEVDLNRIPDIPLNRRTTIRSLAHSLNVNYSTLHRRYKEGLVRRHSNAIKPNLKEENKIKRLQFYVFILDPSTLPHDPKFGGMYNIVHIDEKWFYMTKKSKTYYLLPNEEDPFRSCQSKNYIVKVMFLVAIARPRFDDEGSEIFSGKIGVFPLVNSQPALRRSQNREAGTMETKPITFVTKEVIRSFLLEKVIPAIKTKWPQEESSNTTIFIQQDNARTHVQPSDEEFQVAASQNGFDIRLLCQPPNSPDMNVLDLGFFSALQSLQEKECPRTVDELIGAIQ